MVDSSAKIQLAHMLVWQNCHDVADLVIKQMKGVCLTGS